MTRWRRKKEREKEGKNERNGDASSFCRGVLRRTIKPCRLRGGVMGSPKVNLTAYDLLYLPTVVPLLPQLLLVLHASTPFCFPPPHTLLSALPRGPLTRYRLPSIVARTAGSAVAIDTIKPSLICNRLLQLIFVRHARLIPSFKLYQIYRPLELFLDVTNICDTWRAFQKLRWNIIYLQNRRCQIRFSSSSKEWLAIDNHFDKQMIHFIIS